MHPARCPSPLTDPPPPVHTHTHTHTHTRTHTHDMKKGQRRVGAGQGEGDRELDDLHRDEARPALAGRPHARLRERQKGHRQLQDQVHHLA